MEKLLKSKYYSLIVALIFFIFWLLSFTQFSRENHLASNYQMTIESIEVTLIGIIVLYLLSCYQNMYYVVPWITYTPFVFARPFTSTSIPYALFIAGGLLLIGIIIHLIRFRHKITIGVFFIGLALLVVAIILGGINTKAEFLKQQLLFAIPASISLLAIYVIFSSGVDVNYRSIAHIINNLGVLLVLEVAVSILYSIDPFSFLIYKNINVGWGISNNIAIMLLMTFPTSAYLAITSKGGKVVLYTFSGFAQIMTIIFTYSRGAIAALIIGGALTIILAIINASREGKITLIPYLVSIGCYVVITLVIAYIFVNTKNDTLLPYAEGFKRNISSINLLNLNGRSPIYDHFIEEYKQNIIFGKGLYAPFFDNSFTGGYQWGHSTVIHTMYTMGTVGLVALIIHLAQKYLCLLIRPNLEKIIIALCFFTSGLYGLVDVSYYFINYMIVLIMILVCMEKTIKESFDLV